MRRRRLLGLAAAAAFAHGCSRAAPTPARSPAPDDLEALAEALVDGGQRIDGVPAIDLPDYEVAGERQLPRTVFTPHVGEYDDEDVVDAIVAADGRPRAYPRFITVWHEIVNETFAGEPVSITYCPLTGSTLGFSGRLRGVETSFGVSGRILHSNLVMFDRASTSFWPQLLGVAITGPRKGERLREIPGIVTTTLGRWRARFPNTLVLSTLTGALRPYRTWPYGDYDRSDQLLFPVDARDERLSLKRVVYGVRHGAAAAALEKEAALRRGLTTFALGGAGFVAIADDELASVRVFRAAARGRALTLRAGSGGGAVDEETGSRWSRAGVAIDGPLATERLEQVPAPEVFWFAWHAFHPGTAIVP